MSVPAPHLIQTYSDLSQGDKNELFPIKHAEQLSSQLTNVKDGAILYSVKGECFCWLLCNLVSIKLRIGGSSMLSVIPGHASIMNKVVSNFWSRLPHHASPIRPPQTPVEVRMSKALETLAALTGREGENPSEPLCALSFSCLSPDMIKVQSELLEYYKRDCYRVFSPLTVLGRPLRKCAVTFDSESQTDSFRIDFPKGNRCIGLLLNRMAYLLLVSSFVPDKILDFSWNFEQY